MFGIGVRCPENATLLDGPNHTCRIKSQSFKVAYDKAIVAEWSTDKMDHTALPIWDAIPTTKSREGTSVVDFLAEYPDPRATKLYEDLPDKVAEVCLTQMSFEEHVWQLFFNGTSRMGLQGNIMAWVGVVLVSLQNT